eukprot:CAMPEP_0198702020 /NCGR_PEP_ID=MMETSP1468-20131203/388520_1 /TAXON_ID=1461545 /ORGANISM="Mantoniella sp, Strain CCMP1436" /LENGTH=119 /DNA_ID=CAMNT_0044460495 /DNA_START=2553 /DNA_END=2912 /DNA_ORIENTATION=+
MIEENYDPPGHDRGGEALSDASRGEHGHHPVITQPMRRSALTAKTPTTPEPCFSFLLCLPDFILPDPDPDPGQKQKALHKLTFVLSSRRSKVNPAAKEWVSAGMRVGCVCGVCTPRATH